MLQLICCELTQSCSVNPVCTVHSVCTYVLYVLCLLCISYTETIYFYIIQCMHCIYVIMLYFVRTYIAVLQFLLSKKPAKRKRAFIKDSDESGVSSHTCHQSLLLHSSLYIAHNYA